MWEVVENVNHDISSAFSVRFLWFFLLNVIYLVYEILVQSFTEFRSAVVKLCEKWVVENANHELSQLNPSPDMSRDFPEKSKNTKAKLLWLRTSQVTITSSTFHIFVIHNFTLQPYKPNSSYYKVYVLELWARCADDNIPRLKTTMMVEAQ